MRGWQRFLTLAVLVVFAAPLGAVPALAQTVDGPTVTWDLSMWGGKRAFTEGTEKLAEIVNQRTSGRFTIRLHYAEALSPSRENLDGIQIGAFQAAHLCASYHPGKNPGLTVLDLPFLPLPDFDVIRQVHEAVFQHPAIAKEMERWGARLLMSNPLPQYEFMGVGAPPQTLADWRGKRVRALGGMGEAMRAIGAVPTTVPAPEVYTSLERGVVDAASFPYTYAHGAYRLHEVARWHTGNMAPGTVVCPTVVNLRAWQALPDQYKRLLEEAKPDAYETLKAAYVKADQRWLAEWRQRGLEEIRYSEAELAEFRKIGGQPVWDKWVSDMERQRVPGRELLDLVLETARKAAR
jgi:TRAP-type C4-dicarboxylate transport system substrate-binding protein